jgi:hypothetical protein
LNKVLPSIRPNIIEGTVLILFLILKDIESHVYLSICFTYASLLDDKYLSCIYLCINNKSLPYFFIHIHQIKNIYLVVYFMYQR